MLTKLKKLVWRVVPQTITAKFTFFDIFDAFFAAVRYGFPGRKLKIIGITGTDGKTTTSYLLHSVLTAAGYNTGLISTIAVQIGDESFETGLHVTTPDPWELNRILDQMHKAGCDFVVMEVTSHAIHQHRILGIPFEIAGLTNITHEHLDVHGGSFEKYEQTKLKLLKKAKHAFKASEINRDIIKDVQLTLAGDYNYLNAKLAAAIATYLNVSPEAIKQGLESVSFIEGRMNVVYDEDFMVIVDFAHTPNGLETALTSAKKLIKEGGRLLVVFGAAGERDPYKRPLMGKIAKELADIVVLTAEDPRTEKVADINNALEQGAVEAGAVENETLFKTTHRLEGIRFALTKLARPGDVIMITGKGHEKSMNYGNGEEPWSDVEVVKKILTEDSNSKAQNN